MNQEQLLKGLTQLNKSVAALFNEIQPDQLDWRPKDNMRTIMELANHLAQVPATDLKCCLQGADLPTVQALEASLKCNDPKELFAVWQSGIDAVQAYFAELPPEEFDTKVLKAFYGHEATPAGWLLEMITHAYHHRAQLFTYLKMLGRPIDMFTLYQ